MAVWLWLLWLLWLLFVVVVINDRIMSFEKKKTNQVKNIFTKDNPKEKREINRKKNIQKEEIERKEQI